MNKTLFYIIITVIGLVTLTAIWYPAINKQDSQEAATPANGMVGGTTEDATTTTGTETAPAGTEAAPAVTEENTPAPAPLPSDATAPSPATPETAPTGDVPAGAEVSGDAPASTDMPAAEGAETPSDAGAPAVEPKPEADVPASEGQQQ